MAGGGISGSGVLASGVSASNGLLRAARLERRWSQSRAADELTVLAAARGAPVAAAASLKTQLSRWENGHALPDGHYRALLAELYQRPADQLGLSSEPAGGGPIEQRRLLGGRLAAASAIDTGALALLREQLDTARRLDGRLGAAATVATVRGQLADLELAYTHCLLPERRRRVAELLAETATLAGTQELDLGAVADAWEHYATAADAAHGARAPELVGRALAGQAEVLVEVGRPDDAVRTAERAVSEVDERAPPRSRAALLTGLGRALAANRDATGSARAFDLAVRLADDAAVEIDVAALHRARGHALSLLGDPEAVPELERGLRTDAAEVPIRDLAEAHVDLVVALHAAERGEDAAAEAGRARELTDRIGSERLRGRLDRAAVSPSRR